MLDNYEQLDLPVRGGTLRALQFGAGSNIIVAAHGITASAMAFRAVARHIPDGWRLVALDLRGRGHSAGLPGPFGMDIHADDIRSAIEQLDRAGRASSVTLTGHSMGAYAALRTAAQHPGIAGHLVLIDGGLPLPSPPDADPDQVLAATVGPALQRLAMTFPSEQAYLDFFRAHPALTGNWNEDLEDYVRYDAAGEPGAIRSRVNADAVRLDGRDLITNAASFGKDLAGLAMPALLAYAPLGMLGQEPGLLPEPLVTQCQSLAPRLRTELIPETNHYTILTAEFAAATLAARLTDATSWPHPT